MDTFSGEPKEQGILKKDYFVIGKMRVPDAVTWSLLAALVAVTVWGAVSITRQGQAEQAFLDNVVSLDSYSQDPRFALGARLNTRAIQLSSLLTNVPFNQRSGVLDELVLVAKARKQNLQKLFATSPDIALRLILPDHIRKNLPQEIQGEIEQPATIEGSLEAVHFDYPEPQSSQDVFTLSNDKGEAFNVHLAKQGQEALRGQAGNRIKIHGLLLASVLAIPQGLEAANIPAPVASQSRTLGEQKVLGLIVRFQGSPAVTPAGVDSIKQQLFGKGNGSADNFFRASSYDQTSLSGDVALVDIPITLASITGNCGGKLSSIASASKAQADLQGYTASNYQRVVYFFTLSSGRECGWGGSAGRTEAFIANIGSLIHELGHTYGLQHAHSLDCTPTTSKTTCAVVDYGDPYDAMGRGGSNFAQFNVAQKDKLRWLPPSALTEVSSDGVFILDTMDTPLSDKPKGLKIIIPGKPYYVEFRNPGDNPGASSYKSGAIIHYWEGGSSHLIDPSPESREPTSAALEVGKTFTDPNSKVAITVTNMTTISPRQITVAVKFNSPTLCNFATPTVSVSPQSQIGAPGQALAYTLTVKNNWSGDCPSGPFLIFTDNYLPGGLIPNGAFFEQTLAPGQTITRPFVVTIPKGAINGAYSFYLKAATNNPLQLFLGSTSVGTVVNSSPGTTNQAPIVKSGDDQAMLLSSSASLNGSVTDDGLPNPPGKVTTSWTKVSGPGTVTFSNTANLQTTASFSAIGAYLLRLTADDGQLTSTDDIAITVNPVPPPSTPNAVPKTSAGANQTITLPSSAQLQGTASDDGLPNPPAKLTYSWTKMSGPGAVAFSNSMSLQSSITFSSEGSYVLRLTTSDSVLTNFSDVTIIVKPSPVQPPTPGDTFSDDFNRADASTLGSQWTQVYGSFGIRNNQASNLFGGSNIAVAPQASGASQIEADLTSTNNNFGPRLGIVFGYKDNLNYYAAYRQAGGTSAIGLVKVVNGKSISLGSRALANPSRNVPFRLTARIQNNTITVLLNGATYVTASDPAFSPGLSGITVNAAYGTYSVENFTAK